MDRYPVSKVHLARPGLTGLQISAGFRVIEHDCAEFGNILGSRSKIIRIEYTSLHATSNIEKGDYKTITGLIFFIGQFSTVKFVGRL